MNAHDDPVRARTQAETEALAARARSGAQTSEFRYAHLPNLLVGAFLVALGAFYGTAPDHAVVGIGAALLLGTGWTYSQARKDAKVGP